MKMVTTIIPAFNSALTLSHTIKSAVDQTYPAHEIIIVDDGSTDNTRQIALAWAARHAQIRVVHQANRGLSGARNRGIDEAAGGFVAPLDADDLWHPDKISRQVAAIEATPDTALAYGWFRRIDEQGRVLPGSASPVIQGWSFHRHLDQNFISNGSSPLIRTDVARAIRYDESLNSGEDYLFQLQVAREYRFACVPAYLTGYRLSASSMSRNVERMIRSHLRLFAAIRRDVGTDARRIIDQRIARFEIELARNRTRRGDMVTASGALTRAIIASAPSAATAILDEVRTAAWRARQPMFPDPAESFEHYAPESRDGAWHSGRSVAKEARLTALDAAGPAGF